MRPETRKALDTAVKATIDQCMKLARSMMVAGISDAGVTGLAWSIAQGAATSLREKLETTMEGRAILEYSARESAGKKPS